MSARNAATSTTAWALNGKMPDHMYSLFGISYTINTSSRGL